MLNSYLMLRHYKMVLLKKSKTVPMVIRLYKIKLTQSAVPVMTTQNYEDSSKAIQMLLMVRAMTDTLTLILGETLTTTQKFVKTLLMLTSNCKIKLTTSMLLVMTTRNY